MFKIQTIQQQGENISQQKESEGEVWGVGRLCMDLRESAKDFWSSQKCKWKLDYHLILARLFIMRDKRLSSFIEHMEKRDIFYAVCGLAI